MEEPNVERVLEGMARVEGDRPADGPRQWIVHVSIEHLLPSRAMTMVRRLPLSAVRVLAARLAARHYYYGLGDAVQLSAETMPVR